jgi:hypothetical protein
MTGVPGLTNSTKKMNLDNAIDLVITELTDRLNFDYATTPERKSEIFRAFGLIEGYAKMAEQYAFCGGQDNNDN